MFDRFSLDVWREEIEPVEDTEIIEPPLGPVVTESRTTTTSTTTATTPADTSDVQITFIFYDGLVLQTEADEYVKITNLGTTPVNLEGWRLVDIDEGYPEFVFPSYILEPDKSIRVYTNEFHPEYGGFSFWYGKAIWNNTNPDTAVLYDDQGNEVSRRSY